MNHLLRARAPISDAGWQRIDEEAARVLRHFLTARRLVELRAEHDWSVDVVRRGRVETLPETAPGITARLREVQPLVEYRTAFFVDRAELDAIDRGARDVSLDAVRDAARRIALAEDRAVFHGDAAAHIEGVAGATPHRALPISDDYGEYPRSVARAVGVLQEAGVAGPYAVALGPRCYTGVIETTEMGGFPVLEHLRLIAGGDVLWAPAVEGAVVLSTRGDDFVLTLGQDIAIGYVDHDDETVQLFLEESFTFQVLAPEAAVVLAYR